MPDCRLQSGERKTPQRKQHAQIEGIRQIDIVLGRTRCAGRLDLHKIATESLYHGVVGLKECSWRTVGDVDLEMLL